jgi:hypothetical protein
MNNNFEKQTFEKYAADSWEKFKFTLESKIPVIKTENIDYLKVFELFFIHQGKYSIYFYIDFLQYLDKINADINTKIEVMKHAAITSLYNRNTIYLENENKIIAFTRLDNKIQKYEIESLELFEQNSESLNEWRCNYEV